ncbi:2-dehydro-3-deoxygluconokinase [Lacunisphaera limnophila]|uniref:2-dehydro-3-deoxygluconokinase n=1 Tax=Lacunisphaera limnophila TaxID=1838286 RepID=A0A1D8AX17_9BACT|nr:PfkB family carbohydrate kinase [Lacunisphaera limnophila]AOS45441.1 2-dehydro-3-deoxygluconokinase [Lacunisphaera limnophila]
MPDSRPLVACFGEILWDFLPRGAFPGGAPFNVAYHLHRLGLHAHLISAVGQDLLGDDLLRRLRAWGLETDGVTRHLGLPTGHVQAVLDATGSATYEITQEVAWDQIMPGEDSIRAAHGARALVFGSLAQRSPANRAALNRLLAVLPADAWRVLDVNLRHPHDDLTLVRELARKCTLLKLNAGEAARLTDDTPLPGREEAHARALAVSCGNPLVCVTAGEHGAGLLAHGAWHWVAARPTTVRDTVGAGDAFTAGLLAGLLRHDESPAVALERACRLGEFVAARDGATPAYATDAQGLPVG